MKRPFLARCYWCGRLRFFWQYYDWGNRGGRDVDGRLMCKRCTDLYHRTLVKYHGMD